MRTSILAALIATLVAAGLQSYETLEGRRLARFLKTRARSELGHHVALRFKAKEMAGLEIRNAKHRRQTFDWKKVRFEVKRQNTYWQQTLRKLRKDAKGLVILKGRILARGRGKKRVAYFYIDTAQKTARRR